MTSRKWHTEKQMPPRPVQIVGSLLEAAGHEDVDLVKLQASLNDPAKAEKIRQALTKANEEVGKQLGDSATFYARMNPKPQPQVENPTLKLLFPSMGEKPSTLGKLYAVGRDVATFPLRTVAGFGAGLGDAAAFMDKRITEDMKQHPASYAPRRPTTRPFKFIPEALEAGAFGMQQAMRSPSSSAKETGSTIADIGAGMAEDPLTLPGIYFGIGKNLVGTVGRGLGLGAATYGTHVGDRASSGRDDMFRGETPDQLVSVAAPAVLPVVAKLGGSVVGKVWDVAKGTVGSAGKKAATDLAMSQFKAAPKVRGGEEWEGLKAALESDYKGKPLITQLFTGKESKIPEVVQNYKAIKSEVDANFNPLLEKMKDAGIRIDQDKVMEAVSRDIDDYFLGEATAPSWDEKKIKAAKEFVRKSIYRHFADQAATVEEKAATRDLYKLSNMLKTGKAKPEVFVAKTNSPIGLGTLTPEELGKLAKAGKINQNNYEPLYRYPDGSLRASGAALTYEPLSPKTAHKAKSSMWEEAYKRGPEQESEREYAAKAAGDALKAYMTNPELHRPKMLERLASSKQLSDLLKSPSFIAKAKSAGMTPDDLVMLIDKQNEAKNTAAEAIFAKQAPLLRQWGEQLDLSKPIYGAQQAMARAEHTTANRLPFSLGKLASNPAGHLVAWAQESPATVNRLYTFGEQTEWLEKLAKLIGDNKAGKAFGRGVDFMEPGRSGPVLGARLGEQLLSRYMKPDSSKTKK